MERERVEEDVRRRILSVPGVVEVVFLEGDMREDLIALEERAEENGAAGGMMPFRNEGVWEALDRDVSLVVVLRSDKEILGGEAQPVIMVDGEGQMVGEFINERRKEELRDREDVHFLCEDFVIYSEVEVKGEPIFIMPPLGFRYIEGIEGIGRITSGSISTLSDHYIRERLGYRTTEYWTHLIGFDLEMP
ncbi:MAG: hypothetical protein ACLFUV_03840 [Methanomassiliicoccales archaeon]